MNLYCNEELNQKEIDSLRETEQTTNGKNLLRNKDNHGNYYKFKYKIDDNENINIGNFRGNKQIPTKDGTFFKNNKGKECNSGMNYEDRKKGKFMKIIRELNN